MVVLTLGPVAAHEFWIEPEDFRVEQGATIVADLKVGQHLVGASFPYLKDRFLSFKVTDERGSREVKGDEGDVPAFKHSPATKGLQVMSYHSVADRLRYQEKWEEFVAYAELEGNGWAVEAHRRRGLSETDFTEIYSRYAKALVQVGAPVPTDTDRAVGMPLELVARTNPYSMPATETLTVTLLWQGRPMEGAQVTIFRKTDVVTETNQRTDRSGEVSVHLAGGGLFLLSAVHLRDSPRGDADWESHWASLTFRTSQ